jgi:hypothetical protein
VDEPDDSKAVTRIFGGNDTNHVASVLAGGGALGDILGGLLGGKK